VPFRLYWLWLQYYFFLVFVLHGAPFFTHCYQVLLLFCDKTYFIMQSHLNYYCLFMIVFICLFACSFSVLVGRREWHLAHSLSFFLSVSVHFNSHFSRWTWFSRHQKVSILDVIGAKDNEGGGNNWSYKTCKAPVILSLPTNETPAFYRPGGCPSCHQYNTVKL